MDQSAGIHLDLSLGVHLLRSLLRCLVDDSGSGYGHRGGLGHGIGLCDGCDGSAGDLLLHGEGNGDWHIGRYGRWKGERARIVEGWELSGNMA